MDQGGEYYRDPVVILVPALMIFTAALAAIRLLFWALRLVDRWAGLLPGYSLYFSLRQLGRQSRDLTTPLLLVIVSCSLGVYTLSVSASLDRWASDQAYYAAGADLAFTPEPASAEYIYSDGSWIPIPSEFEAIEGVLQATRVADLEAGIRVASGRELRGRFLGIDRVDFPAVAWFRRDFAFQPLGELMNRLAQNPMGILVPEKLLDTYGLKEGDRMRVLVSSDREVQERSVFTIVGSFRYFPTVYDDQEVTVVGNLDAFSTLLGFTVSHEIWLKLQPGAGGEAVLANIPIETRVRPAGPRNPAAAIAHQRDDLERVGVWGAHSEGFLAAAGMAILGLLVFSYASLRERLYQFAILRSLGLDRPRLIFQVCLEYAGLAACGAGLGIFIGRLVAELIVPYSQAAGPGGLVPPLLPVVPAQAVWEMGLAITLFLVLAELATVLFTMRRSLTELVKSM